MPDPGRNIVTTSSACSPASAPTTIVLTIAAPATRSSAGRISGLSTATTAIAGAVITISRSSSSAVSTSTLLSSWNRAMHAAWITARIPTPTRLPDLPWK